MKDEITVTNAEIVSMVEKQLKRWKYHVKAWKVIFTVEEVTKTQNGFGVAPNEILTAPKRIWSELGTSPSIYLVISLKF